MLPQCQAGCNVDPGLSPCRPYRNPEEIIKIFLFDREKLQGTKHKKLNGKRQVGCVGSFVFHPSE